MGTVALSAQLCVKKWLGVHAWQPVSSCPVCGGESFSPFSTENYGLLKINLRRCDGCSLVVQSPCLTPASMESFYRSDYRASRGAGHRETLFERGIRRGTYIAEFLRTHGFDPQGKRIFEIGCGYGGILEQFRRLGATVRGVDSGSTAIAYGAAKGLNLEVGSLDVLMRSGDNADLVILSHTLEHVFDPAGFLKGVRDVLKEGGWLYVEVPGLDNPKVRQNRYSAQPGHLLYFTEETLRRLVGGCGFQLVATNSVIQSVFQKA
jgi:SAM-dependent methyltransferase